MISQAPSTQTQQGLDEVARRVRAARAYAGLSAKALAEHVGVGMQTIKRIEAGRRQVRPAEIWAIAAACTVPREFFEMDFARLCEQSGRQMAVLRSIDERLARLESALARHG